MNNQQLCNIITEIKTIKDENHSPYEILVSVLKQIDDTDSRLANVVTNPAALTR